MLYGKIRWQKLYLSFFSETRFSLNRGKLRLYLNYVKGLFGPTVLFEDFIEVSIKYVIRIAKMILVVCILQKLLWLTAYISEFIIFMFSFLRLRRDRLTV